MMLDWYPRQKAGQIVFWITVASILWGIFGPFAFGPAPYPFLGIWPLPTVVCYFPIPVIMIIVGHIYFKKYYWVYKDQDKDNKGERG